MNDTKGNNKKQKYLPYEEYKKQQKNKKKAENEGLSNYVFGKVSPQAIPLEEAVLGALMLDKDAMFSVLDMLDEKSFYLEAHQVIYKAMIELFKAGEPIDLLTVTEKVKNFGKLELIGGPYYLVELTNRVASSANIEKHARIIQQKSIRRQLIEVASKIISKAYSEEDDVFDLLDDADIEMLKIKEGLDAGRTESKDKIAQRFVEKIEKASKRDNSLAGERIFGIPELDEGLNGVEETDFILIPGRPAMGKSSLLNAAVVNAVNEDLPIAAWSFEMPTDKTFGRAVSAIAEIDGIRMSKGEMNDYEWQKLYDATEKVRKSKVIIKDDICTIYQFKSQVISLKRKHNIQAVIVDRIELFKKSNPNLDDTRHVGQISPILRQMANEIKIPLIVLSQLNRSVETRGGAKRPQLSDIRNSGNLEQDAVKVCFVYRPEYYQILEDEMGNDLRGKAEIIIAKNNNGSTGTVNLKFKKSYTTFTSLEDNKSLEDVTSNENNISPNNSNNKIMMSTRANDDDIPF